ncbi:MAG: hypothetical protein JW776_16310 [Candidatus Lokiarchaeota archaeon]|nr:hypothetical protein [Candidatus Lokiarchaeota archaeon]
MNEKKNGSSENSPVKKDEEELDLIASAVNDFSKIKEIKSSEPKKSVEHLIRQEPEEKIEKKAQEYLEKQKDYSKYEQVRTEYPLFLQLPNACGLSSILMLVDPLHNEKIANLLTKIWEHYARISGSAQDRKEFQWAYALEYLLLKSAAPNDLLDYIKSLGTEELENYYLGLDNVLRGFQQKHKQTKNHLIMDLYEEFFNRGLINQFLVSQHLGLFKHNPEIRILMALLGYEFISQPSPDGTGALFFTEEELSSKLEQASAKKKMKILRSEFIKGARIICGFSFHWVAMTNLFGSIGNMNISVNDPEGEKYTVALKELSDRDRFYVYRKMKSTPKKIWKRVFNILENDGPREIELFENYIRIKEDIMESAKEEKEQENLLINTVEKVSPSLRSTDEIPIKIHENTLQSIKRTKNNIQETQSSEIHKKNASNDTHDDHDSSREAFLKKMKKIIEGGFQDYKDL